MVDVHSKGKKTLIFGNGGSAAMASHFSVDLTKNARIRCVNYNESDLITCFANDFGFDHWVAKAVEFFGDEGDLLIVISSSGRSMNMINAVEAAKKCQFSDVVTLSGHSKDNPLNGIGDINLWVDSKAYNFVENIHQKQDRSALYCCTRQPHWKQTRHHRNRDIFHQPHKYYLQQAKP